MRRLVIAAAALASAACTTIDTHNRIEGWPDLAITEHRVPAAQMHARCKRYVGFLQRPLACAEINLATKRCDIWLDAGYAPAWVVEHERLHCQGHDHVGETAMRDFFNRFQAEGRK